MDLGEAVLGVAAVGLLVWALTPRQHPGRLASTSQQLSSSKQELDTTTKKLDESQQQVEQLESEEATDRRKRVGGALLAAGGLGAVRAVYDDLAEQLGATNEELETTQEDLDAATKEADMRRRSRRARPSPIASPAWVTQLSACGTPMGSAGRVAAHIAPYRQRSAAIPGGLTRRYSPGYTEIAGVLRTATVWSR